MIKFLLILYSSISFYYGGAETNKFEFLLDTQQQAKEYYKLSMDNSMGYHLIPDQYNLFKVWVTDDGEIDIIDELYFEPVPIKDDNLKCYNNWKEVIEQDVPIISR